MVRLALGGRRMKSKIELKRYVGPSADLMIRSDGKQCCIWIEPESEFFTVSARHMEAIIKCFDALEALGDEG